MVKTLTRQLDILVFNTDEITVLAQLGGIEEANRDTELGQPDQLFPVDAVGVMKDTATVDDSDSLVVGEEDLVRAKVTIFDLCEWEDDVDGQRATYQDHQSEPW